MAARKIVGFLALALGQFVVSSSSLKPLVSEAGDVAAIPQWHLQSSSAVPGLAKDIAKPGVDTSKWHHVPVSKCTLMACLLEIGVYEEQELWYSDNLNDVNWGSFRVPYYYRHEFALKPERGRHFVLQTHGITSGADIYVNGEVVADRTIQSGSFSGQNYDITNHVARQNALLVKTYPTDYYKDLALGFIDWNPRPPDNGSGIWRDVHVKQTGPIFLETISAVVGLDPASVTLRAKLQNLERRIVKANVEVLITEPAGGKRHVLRKSVSLSPGQKITADLKKTFDKPQIWWPKQWGKQPLYDAMITVKTDSVVSDVGHTKFGLRTVTSVVNKDEDILFSVNGQPFQVRGGGYAPDMFMRWDPKRFEAIVKYMLDMGLNTIRLEGHMEHPELYEIADRLGLMILAGYQCCNKWESWEYNNELGVDPVYVWDDNDYSDANVTMRHEAEMLQTHPSMLAFLIGSDFWPDDRATAVYVEALKSSDWQVPIVPSASKRGYPEQLGPSGMKMNGPYDWVPPNYWYDTEPSKDRLGAAFGFGSELGAGVGTPELSSLRKFLTEEDIEDLWQKPDKGLFHMSTNISSFHTRSIYNEALYKRYGKPSSIDDYLRKAQVLDYEAIRAEFEGFSSLWSTGRIATGLIYWMLNNAWPSLHWNQFDYYLHPGGTYFGSKVGARVEHVAYNYVGRDLWIINHSLDRAGPRTVEVEMVDLKGKTLSKEILKVQLSKNSARSIGTVSDLDKAQGVVFLRLNLLDDKRKTISRNVYWVAPGLDKLEWSDNTWYYTPVSDFADYTSLFAMERANVRARITTVPGKAPTHTVALENKSDVPAFFIRLNLATSVSKTPSIEKPYNVISTRANNGLQKALLNIHEPDMSDSDTHLARRRNGRLVACNPCRARKVACDHSRPVCTRCLKRKQGSRCVYPEPSTSTPAAVTPAPATTGSSERSLALQAQRPVIAPSTHPRATGFVGFASQSAVFEDTNNFLSLLGVPVAEDVEAELEGRSQPQNVSFRDLPRPLQESCLFVLRCLPGQVNEQIKFVKKADVGRGWGHVAVDLIAHSLQQTFHQLLGRGEAGLEAMVTILCSNTAQPFLDIHDDPRAWLSQFCGANLRWESLGLLWAQVEKVSDALDSLENRSVEWLDGKAKTDVANACVGYCIEACRFFTSGNDLLLDICRRKIVLDALVHGDNHVSSFMTAGIATSMMSFLGVHVLEDGPSYVPSLCSETKRRIFCHLYSLDKLGMVFTGRPPLIHARYCSTPMPLDLRDEDLIADPVRFSQAVQSLDDKGWNTDGGVYPATIIRARYLVSRVREDIFDIALAKSVSNSLDQLLRIRARQLALMDELPAFLNYEVEDTTTSTKIAKTGWARLLLRLENLQNLFFVDKLLLRHGYLDDGDLLVWSYELVVFTLRFWTNKDWAADSYRRRNYEWLTMAYAAPGSGILCQELLQPTFSGVHHKNPQLTRSNIVQQLSLLVGFLDWLPRTAPNWEVCEACKRVIQRVLDHHLNGTAEHGGVAASDPSQWGFLDQPEFGFELLDTFDWMHQDGE
ncbi:glycoside hydrolase family 2 protein [Paramyrothecium foliicola]|nr:glycoside hydrolase family 2 protein [Paramyrothecium foliicola]